MVTSSPPPPPGSVSSPIAGGRWWTWANAITGVRLAAAPLCACAIVEGSWGGAGAALVFWLAVATDVADGRVARIRGEASPLGGLLDHATDALFVSIGLAALATLGSVPAVLPALVAAAFVQYTLDSRALAGRPLRASGLGRWNGVAYYVLLGVPLTRDLLALDWPADRVVRMLGWALVLSTLASMLDRARALLRARRS